MYPEEIMSPEEFKRKMQRIKDENDPESGHFLADDLMEDILCSLGYGDGIDIFESMTKWYA